MLDQIRIVLVRTIRAGNIGSSVRAMMNMGLSDIVLVAPEAHRFETQALGFAARAKPLLDSARVVPTIADALDGCVATFATSGKGGPHRREAAVTPWLAGDLAMQAIAAGGRVAIAFGPEDRGLLQEEILQFDRVIEIPSNPDYPALNLAAAVTVVCYELRQAWLRHQALPPLPAQDPRAADGHKRIVCEKLFDALELIGFFRQQQDPNHLRYAIRRVLGRADLSVNEADIFIGMAQQIMWHARNRRPEP